MNWRKKLLESSRLYVVLDKAACGPEPLTTIARQLARKPGMIFQLRDKSGDRRRMLEEAHALRRVLEPGKTLFIINDYPDIAMIAGADGVHLGQQDLPADAVRRLIGPDKIIGISCSSVRQALAAQKEGADYLGIGPVFTTSTKADARPIAGSALTQAARGVRIPLFAIGGITLTNVRQVIDRGVRRVAVCKALCCAKDRKAASEDLYRFLYSR